MEASWRRTGPGSSCSKDNAVLINSTRAGGKERSRDAAPDGRRGLQRAAAAAAMLDMMGWRVGVGWGSVGLRVVGCSGLEEEGECEGERRGGAQGIRCGDTETRRNAVAPRSWLSGSTGPQAVLTNKAPFAQVVLQAACTPCLPTACGWTAFHLLRTMACKNSPRRPTLAVAGVWETGQRARLIASAIDRCLRLS